MVSRMYSRDIPMILMTVSVIVVLADYYIASTTLRDVSTNLQNWGSLLIAFTVYVACGMTLMNNINQFNKRAENWYFAGLMPVIFIVYTIFGLIVTPSDINYAFVVNNVVNVIYGTLSSTTAFFSVSAAYRAFRARNWNAVIMLTIFLVTVFGNMSLGMAMFPGIDALRDWINTIPASAGLRALVITSCVGLIGFGIRMILGHEKGYFGGGSES